MWISFQNFLIDLDGEKSPNGLIGNGKFQFRVSLQNSFDLRIPTVNNFYIRRMNGLRNLFENVEFGWWQKQSVNYMKKTPKNNQ